MLFGDVEVPQPLIDSLERGKLVVFAGAGVSAGPPSNLPNFTKLAKQIARGTGLELADHMSEDRFLGLLEERTGTKVHEATAEILTQNDPAPNQLHRDLVGLFQEAAEVRIVTTNFDTLFEEAAREELDNMPEVYDAPLLPPGNDFTGIVHLHGNLVTDVKQIVLTDRDFGRAYLGEGRARRFLLEMLPCFDVLFVGYSHNDMIMQYLVRGLPYDLGRERYALVDKDDKYDPEWWRFLGVHPLGFDNPSGDFSALYGTVEKWRHWRGLGALDIKRRVRQIVEKSEADPAPDVEADPVPDVAAEGAQQSAPPLSPQDTSFLRAVIKSVSDVEYFTEYASEAGWLNWLEQHGFLDFLFDGDEPTKPEAQLVRWMASKIALTYPDSILRLMRERECDVPEVLASAVLFELAYGDVETRVVKWWGPFVVTALPKAEPSLAAYELLANSVEPHGLLFLAISIFEYLTQPLPSPEVAHQRNSEGPWPASPYEVSFLGDVHQVRDCLNLSPETLDDEARRELWSVAMQNLRRAHRCIVTWGSGTLCLHRSAIEPHEQDERLPRDVDVLIDVVRDLLIAEVGEDSRRGRCWLDELLESKAPLFHRIALHALSSVPWISADQALELVMEREWLFDTLLKHEVFGLLRDVFSNASPQVQSEVVSRIAEWEPDELSERTAAYEKYNLLGWLQQADANCQEVVLKLEEIQESYPEFGPRDHPDLGFFVGDAQWLDEDPRIGAGDWLGMASDAVIETWNQLEAQEAERFQRRADGREIAGTAKQSFDWGRSVSQELLAQGRYDSTLWVWLFEGWQQLELRPEQWAEVLAPLSEQPPITAGRRELSELLRRGMSGKEISVDLFKQANTVARKLWSSLDSNDVWEQGDWYHRAINSVAGRVAEYWLYELSRLVNMDGQLEGISLDSVLDEVANLVAGEEDRHLVARSALCRELAFLVGSCRDWTIEHIVPLLDWNEYPDDAEAAWDGFAGESQISPQLVDACFDAYQSVLPHIDELHARTWRGVVSHFAVVAVHLGDDTLDKWVWPLLRHTKQNTRSLFLKLAGNAIAELDAPEQENVWDAWLREFWQAWEQGRPQQMTPLDRAALVNLAIRAEHLFPRCVALIEEWGDGPIAYDDLMLFSLTRGDNLAKHHPEETATLVRKVAELLPDDGFEFCGRFHYRIRDLIEAGVISKPMEDVCERLRAMGCPRVHKLLEMLEEKRSSDDFEE